MPESHHPPITDIPPGDPVYLGDGAYASYDGYQLWVGANHHTSRLVALDASALRALLTYAERRGILP